MSNKIVIDGLALAKEPIWDNESEWLGLISSSEQTLGGRTVAWHALLQDGRPIDLVATVDQGWFSRAERTAMIEKASVPGATYMLTIGDRGSFRVRFRTEDPPAVDLEPMVSGPDAADNVWYTGRVKFVTA
jgi:hypothetical protein